ncbi:restriction endonuclease subunit M [Candidatus Korarchaeum cryptofilum]|jgi:hypothetical protein|uniref:Restriction endonuclease subunit M n=1 Tax=Candidatus Korarchaeum cryptofilum TaxID=498846 RepID=A0A429G2E6_9CREN|nr:N-6 DNA methylase [Candidatus Korarchaeum cryptofilum]RSN67997.1 restriction endonuclease subunit M [Candidatus Korarchaeum cryptofilum]
MRISDILKKLDIEPINEESFQILIASLKTILKYAGDIESLMEWDAPVITNFNKLNSDEIKFIKSEVQKTNLSIRECQTRVQKIVPQEKRKKFAVYYTIKQGTNLMASIVEEYLSSRDGKIVLADPFLGSGSTLTTTIERVGAERIEKVWGIEPLPLPALVAYASLIHSMNGKKDAITVIVGDAFEEIPKVSSPFMQSKLSKADIILTNPPFTRWKYLERNYRENILSVAERLGYKKYITRREVSLQTLSMFLCDHILNSGGLLISVLPASTFYTIYGKGYKSLLRERYDIIAMIECRSRASFSEDSGFKEIIIVAIKGSNKRPTAIIGLDNNIEEVAKDITSSNIMHHDIVDLHSLPRFLDINWLALFEENRVRDLIIDIFNQGLKNGTLGYWSEILGKDSIVRGVEIYGPEFFFIPNRYWNIIEEQDNFIKMRGKDRELIINRDFLVRTLRKPSLYSHKIEADVRTFMLSIPQVEIEDLPHDLKEYIRWGSDSGTAKPAMDAYGRFWYSHVHRQIKTKEPFGHVFIPDKVDLLFKNRGVFANYTKERVAASKNFYIVKDEDEARTKILIGWLSSTIFISVLVLLGRKISETWTRFLENDYLELPVINLNKEDETMSEVIGKVDRILTKHLPPLWEQLGEEYRYELDLAIARFIGLENPERVVENLYQLLSNRLYKIQ